MIQERDSGNVPTVAYTRGQDLSGSFEGAGGIGGLLARSHGYSAGSWSAHNHYHADGNGNVTYLVDSIQGLAASYRYDPYGRVLASSGALAGANVYRFSSKELHVKSGMYYYGYRFYDPHLQRWLNRDPMGHYSGKNLYAFAGHRPVNAVDTDGLQWMPTPGLRPVLPGIPSISCKGGRVVPYVPFELSPEMAAAFYRSHADQRGYYCVKRCQFEHEWSHAADVESQNPDICKGVPDGVRIVNPDSEQLLESELKAYRVELKCLEKCKPCNPVNERLLDTRKALEKMEKTRTLP